MNVIKQTAINWLTPLFAIMLMLGCESRPGVTAPTDTTSPEVSWTSPVNAATQVVLNTKVAATFSEAMAPASLTTQSFTLLHGNSVVPGTVTYTGMTATFDPDSELLPNTVYTATITTEARNLTGIPLAASRTWSFTTGTSLAQIAPTVQLTDPTNAATGIPLNQKISAMFSTAMDANSISSTTFTLKKGTTTVAGTVTYTGTTALFAPNANLTANTVYTATIAKAAMDLAGNALAANYQWTFTTGTSTVTTPPLVSFTDPVTAATDIPLNQKIAATFSKTMDASTITTASYTLANGSTLVPAFVSYSGTTAILAPTANLLPNTQYTATINATVKDLTGNALASQYRWTFTTGASTVVTPPVVHSTDPASNDTAVALNQKIAVTFSKAMDVTTLTTTSFKLKKGSETIAGLVSVSGATGLFTPTVNLLPNTLYTASVDTTVTDLAGNALATKYQWTFTTGASTVVTPPTVVSTTPLSNATGVLLSAHITATFSKTMNALTLTTASFVVKHGAVAVEGLVSYLGKTATFIPSDNLLPNTVYSVSISTAAQDLASNAIAQKYDWTFTTGAAVVIVAPVVSYTFPATSADDIAIPSALAVVFSKAMDTLTLTTSSFTLKKGITSVAGAVSYVGDTVKFTPTTPLLPSTTYTATITTNAKDTAGTPLASNYVWSFTTLPLITAKLNNAASFGGFGGSAGLTNQGIYTVIHGDMGTTGACTLVTGFHDMTGEVFTETPLNVGDVTGTINCAPPAPGTATKLAKAQAAIADAQIAFDYFAGLPGGPDPGAGELGGLVLAPGTYTAAGGTFGITSGNLTLDAQNNPNAQWVFQMASTLTVGQAGTPRSIILVNGAQAKNVVWQVGSAATINGTGGGTMVGTILSYSGVTFSTAGNVMLTTLNGRAISLNASVTVVNTVINMP